MYIKTPIQISELKEQIILGSLLGDAGINKDRRYEGYEFSDRHSLKQKEYLKWKNLHLNFNFKIYKKHNLCAIRKNNIIFKKYRNLFYKNGVKIVTKEILDKVNPLALAIWHMDDGDYHYRSDAIRIYTQAFKLEGNKIIKKWFKEKLGIITKIRKIHYKEQRKNYFYLEINSSNAKKFIRLINNYVVDSMRYKIGLDKERRKNAEAKKSEYNKKWWKNNEDKRISYYQKWKKLNYQAGLKSKRKIPKNVKI